MLTALELPTTNELQVLRRGVELAMELKQHLFDSYYHGVALETPDCVLITADERYLRAARAKGKHRKFDGMEIASASPMDRTHLLQCNMELVQLHLRWRTLQTHPT
jgi:hypothetical protein